jgi:hypothetical protein
MVERVQVIEDWKSYNDAVEKYAAKYNFKEEIEPNIKLNNIYDAREQLLRSSTYLKYIFAASVALIALGIFAYISVLAYKRYFRDESVLDKEKLEIIQKIGDVPELRINKEDLNLLSKKEETYLRIHPDDIEKIITRNETSQSFPKFPQSSTNATETNQVREKPVVNYTIFNNVKWRSYEVVTGYLYNSNKEVAPNYQYCYLKVPSISEVSMRTISLANSSYGKAYTSNGADGFSTYELSDALNSCVWFNNKIPF